MCQREKRNNVGVKMQKAVLWLKALPEKSAAPPV
jgi:hypothetical protein